MNTNKMFVLGAPILAGSFFLLWFILPVGWTAFISFYDYSPLSANYQPVGFANYYEALFTDTVFWKATLNSFYFALGNVVLGTLLALLVANAISRLRWWRAAAKFAFFMPALFSIVAAAVVWKEIFQPRYGILNNGLYWITDTLGLPGIPEIGWTTTTQWSMPTIILFGLWKNLGIRIIILLAAIETIPKMYFEVATVDGVSARKQFWGITVPLIKPALWFVIITGIINSLQVFEPMFVITDGGPVRSSMSLVMLISETGFTGQRFGYAASISMLLLAMILVMTSVLFWVRRRQAKA